MGEREKRDGRTGRTTTTTTLSFTAHLKSQISIHPPIQSAIRQPPMPMPKHPRPQNAASPGVAGVRAVQPKCRLSMQLSMQPSTQPTEIYKQSSEFQPPTHQAFPPIRPSPSPPYVKWCVISLPPASDTSVFPFQTHACLPCHISQLSIQFNPRR